MALEHVSSDSDRTLTSVLYPLVQLQVHFASMDAVRLMTPQQLETTPAKIPPPGIFPDFIDPPTIGYRIVGVVTVLMVIAWIFAALRFYTAIVIRRKIMLDDWTAFLAVVCHERSNNTLP